MLMKKILAIVFFCLFFFLLQTEVSASEKIAGSSASFSASIDFSKSAQEDKDYLVKKIAIKRVLEDFNSPLVDHAEAFTTTCIKYSLDCYLLPSIAGIESSFGKLLNKNSYNSFGWGGGDIVFKNWEDGIDRVGRGLRANYLDKGLVTLPQIGYVYANKSTTWAYNVSFFMKRFYNEEEKLQILKK